MIVAFTGTRKGMTFEQRETVRDLLADWPTDLVLHGSCVGADAETHGICWQAAIPVEVFPATGGYRENCGGPHVRKIHRDAAPLARNRTMVDRADVLVAAVRTLVEEPRGSGTWATIRYARKTGRSIVIVRPDGRVIQDGIDRIDG